MPQTRFGVGKDLLRDARKAQDWYETTGMKVAQNPAIPRDVAGWILRHCYPIEEDKDTP